MIDSAENTTSDLAVALLIHYSFDLGGYTAGELIDLWLNDYPANWVRLAVIEALYQGRYKGISVEQILAFWNRRGQALYHFNHEFERLVCGNFPQTLTEQPDTTTTASPPVPAAVGLSKGHNDPNVVTAEEGAGEKTPVQLVDATAKGSPSTKQMGAEPLQKKNHQNSDNDQRSRSPGIDNRRPIEQFTPADDGSEFYSKLKAIAQQKGDGE